MTQLTAIEAWLRTHAPRTLASLAPPAEPTDIAQAENIIGDRIPTDLRNLYEWHNGSTNVVSPFWLAPEFGFTPIAEMTSTWRYKHDSHASDPDVTAGTSHLWHPAWLPIGSDWCGGVLAAEPTADRTTSAVIPVEIGNGAMRHLGWPSLEALLEEMLSAFQTGTPLGTHTIAIEDGNLQWHWTSQN